MAFIDPRRSQVDVVQAVGRAIRKAENKALGYIVIPVLVGADSDPGEAVEASEFDRVWEVLRGLRDHDDDLADELDALRREQGRRGSVSERPRKVVLDLPTRIGRSFASAFDARLVETTTREWEFKFGVLERFVGRERHCLVPRGHVEASFRLGQWVGVQRTRRRSLSAERRRRFEELPGWSWNLRETSWERTYRALASFAAREGHARPTIRHQEDGVELGRWVNVQRTRFGKRQLRPDRVAALEALPGWVWDVNEADWEAGFDALTRFVNREGHADVQYRQVEGGYPLGTWIAANRTDGKAGRLAPSRAARLESLPGWVWSRHESKWDTMYAEAARLSETGAVDGSRREAVSRWLAKQRTAYRSGRLSPERQERLEQLPGFSWTADEDRWTQMHGLLVAFASRERHALVPQGHIEDGERLGIWVSVQRREHRDRKLSPVRVAQLEAVEGWSWSAARWTSQWAGNFDVLRRHAARTGSALVRDDEIIDGIQIGTWARKQRSLHKSGSLSTERARQLAALPGWTWSVQGDRWTAAYELLRLHAERQGSARLPEGTRVDGYNLSYWARKQRSLYRSGHLSEDRTRLLEALPGWRWDDLRGDRLPRRPRVTDA